MKLNEKEEPSWRRAGVGKRKGDSLPSTPVRGPDEKEEGTCGDLRKERDGGTSIAHTKNGGKARGGLG